MSTNEYVEFKLRFTFAGRLLLFLMVIAAVGFGWLAFLNFAESGESFPVFLPFAIGAGGAALLFGLMRVVLHVCGIQFWSIAEQERRAKKLSNSLEAEDAISHDGNENAETDRSED